MSKGEASGSYENFFGSIQISNPVPRDANNSIPFGRHVNNSQIFIDEFGPTDNNGVKSEMWSNRSIFAVRNT